MYPNMVLHQVCSLIFNSNSLHKESRNHWFCLEYSYLLLQFLLLLLSFQNLLKLSSLRCPGALCLILFPCAHFNNEYWCPGLMFSYVFFRKDWIVKEFLFQGNFLGSFCYILAYQNFLISVLTSIWFYLTRTFFTKLDFYTSLNYV